MNYIYKIIYDIVKDYETTQDLLQETYIRIYNSISQLQDPRAFFAWAGRIATNITFRHLQKYRLETLAYANEEGELEYFFDRASEDQEAFIPEDILVKDSSRKIIADIIDSLSPEQKIAVQYYYFEDMSVGEIAQAMECSEGTIKSRLNYARNAIKNAVLSIEQTQGIRLHSMAAFPILWYVFRESAETFFFSQGTVAAVGTIGVAGYASTSASVGAAGYNVMEPIGAGAVNNAVVGAASVSTGAGVGAAGIGTSSAANGAVAGTAGTIGGATVGVAAATGISLTAKIAIVIGSLLVVGGTSYGAVKFAESKKNQTTETTVETTTEEIQEAGIAEVTEEITEETTEEVVDEVDEVELYKSYVKEVLIPEYGVCLEGRQVRETEYNIIDPANIDSDTTIVEDKFILGGIESVLIDDLDMDGKNELLVIRQVQDGDGVSYAMMPVYDHYLCLYGVNENNVELLDERTISIHHAQSDYEEVFTIGAGSENSNNDKQFVVIAATDKKYILVTCTVTSDSYNYSNLLMEIQGKKIVNVASVNSYSGYGISSTEVNTYNADQISTEQIDENTSTILNGYFEKYGLNIEYETEEYSSAYSFGFVKPGQNVTELLYAGDGPNTWGLFVDDHTDFREW